MSFQNVSRSKSIVFIEQLLKQKDVILHAGRPEESLGMKDQNLVKYHHNLSVGGRGDVSFK